MSLKLKAFLGVKWNFIASIIVFVLGFVQLYILVRYLSKSDFGTMAVSVMLIGYCSSLSDFGLNNAIIHKKDISKTQRSTIFWLIILFSIVFFLILYSSSSAVAVYFQNPDLSTAIKYMSISLLFQACGGVFNSFHQKRLDFKYLSVVNIFSTITGFTVAVVLAIKGLGYMALVYAFLVSSLIRNLLYIWHGWRSNPISLDFDLSGIKYFLSYGKFEVSNQALSNLSRRMDTFIIAKIIGMEMLGVYDILKNLLRKPQSLIVPVFTDVSFPLLSNVQESLEKKTTIYLKQLEMIYFFVAPIYAFLIFNASDVLRLYLGEEWLEYKRIFILFSVYFLIRISGTPVGGFLRAIGKVKHLFWWNTLVSVIVITLLLIFTNANLMSVVIVLLSIQILMIIPNYILNLKPNIKTNSLNYHKSYFIPIALALITYGSTNYILNPDISLISNLLLQLFTGGVGYLIVVYIFNNDIIKSIFFTFKRKLADEK